MRDNIILADISREQTTTDPLYQWDYGQVLKLTGADLPEAYQVHFAMATSGEAIVMIGGADGVAIPDQLLDQVGQLHAWLYLHSGDADGETVRHIYTRIIPRAKPGDEEPTPEQQSAIDQAIAALNAGVDRAEDAADAADQSAQDAAGYASAASTSATAAATSATNASTSATAGALRVGGGIGVGSGIYSNGDINIQGSTAPMLHLRRSDGTELGSLYGLVSSSRLILRTWNSTGTYYADYQLPDDSANDGFRAYNILTSKDFKYSSANQSSGTLAGFVGSDAGVWIVGMYDSADAAKYWIGIVNKKSGANPVVTTIANATIGAPWGNTIGTIVFSGATGNYVAQGIRIV